MTLEDSMQKLRDARAMVVEGMTPQQHADVEREIGRAIAALRAWAASSL